MSGVRGATPRRISAAPRTSSSEDERARSAIRVIRPGSSFALAVDAGRCPRDPSSRAGAIGLPQLTHVPKDPSSSRASAASTRASCAEDRSRSARSRCCVNTWLAAAAWEPYVIWPGPSIGSPTSSGSRPVRRAGRCARRHRWIPSGDATPASTMSVPGAYTPRPVPAHTTSPGRRPNGHRDRSRLRHGGRYDHVGPVVGARREHVLVLRAAAACSTSRTTRPSSSTPIHTPTM